MRFKVFYHLQPGDTVKICWGFYQAHVFGTVIRLGDRNKMGYINKAKIELVEPGSTHSSYRWFHWKDLREMAESEKYVTK